MMTCLFSCVSIKQQKLEEISPLSSTKSLEGTYLLYKSFDVEKNTILKEKKETSGFHKISCNIIAINKTKILVANFLDDSCISREFIKGRIKNNFFVSRRKFKIIPLIVYNTWKSSQTQFYLGANQNLRVEQVSNDGGWVLVIAGGHYWHFVREYIRWCPENASAGREL
ncbi:hypothetical protein [Niabella sp.]|uniref:hypothetical protein n=1 Tax=Niabella sp. TaxID=1962976 RepID=UPI00263789BC|nr:hypothetical protein [Niabella sp.]